MPPLPASIVATSYRHVEKSAYPLADIDVGDRLKWYAVREHSRDISEKIVSEARTEVARLADPGDVGFVILHLCGDEFFFLLICLWRNNNELWETVLAKDGEGSFGLVSGGVTRATFCVWELAVVGAERMAWAEFLKSERDESDLRRYESERYSGVV